MVFSKHWSMELFFLINGMVQNRRKKGASTDVDHISLPALRGGTAGSGGGGEKKEGSCAS